MISSFFIILLAFSVYAILHSLLASLKAKELAERWFGAGFRRFYRLIYVLIVSITLLPILMLVWLLPDQTLYAIAFPWVVLSGLLQFLAAVGLLVGVAQTGALRFLGFKQITEGAAEAHPPRLVTGGVYRYARHPLYLFGLVFIWLMPVMTLNLLALNIGLTAYMFIGSIFEENKLVKEYGQEYVRYRQDKPRILPFPRKGNRKEDLPS